MDLEADMNFTISTAGGESEDGRCESMVGREGSKAVGRGLVEVCA